MSDLSFLIQNQKQVVVDKSYLQKCSQQQPSTKPTLAPTATTSNPPTHSQHPQHLSSRQIKINTNFMPNKRKPNSPHSQNYNISNSTSMKSQAYPYDSNQQIYKMGMRVDALDENQKRLEQRFAREFANLHEVIFKKRGEYGAMMAELNNIKGEINESKKVIGQVLNDITKK